MANIAVFQTGDPGSIPGRCNAFCVHNPTTPSIAMCIALYLNE